MPDETLEPDDIDLPTKEIDPEESVADRMTDNVRNDVGPSRYFQKDANGNPTEDWSDVFERVGQNVAVPEAVHHDIPISVSKEHLADWVSDEKAEELFFNPSHPSRNNPDPDVTKQYRDLDEEIAKYVDYEKLTDVTESAPGSLHDRLTDEADRFERMMAEQRFMPNTPTLINAGSELQMLSACFVYYPGDSLIDDPGDRSSILEVAKEAAATFKGGGGVGYPLHLMRPKGDRISSTGGVSSGPMSFAQIYNTVCGTIQQGGCVATDERVMTDDGYVPFNEVYDGPPLGRNTRDNLVYTRGGSMDSIVESVDSATLPTITVETKSGYEITVTENHPLLTLNGGELTFTEAGELTERDTVVLSAADKRPETRTELCDIEDIEVYRSANTVNSVPDVVTDELATFLGVLWGDGHITGDSLVFSLGNNGNGDADAIEFVTTFLDTHGISYITTNKAGSGKGDYTRIDINSTVFTEWMETNGLCKDSDNLADIPEAIYRSPAAIPAFLGGLTVDGCYVSDAGTVRYDTVSGEFASTIQDLLLTAGVPSKISKGGADHSDRYGDSDMYHISVFPGPYAETYDAVVPHFLDGDIGYTSGERQNTIPDPDVYEGILDENFVKNNKLPADADEDAVKRLRRYARGDRYTSLHRARDVFERAGIDTSQYEVLDTENLFEPVAEVRDSGSKRVYDIENKTGEPEFVASNFVVHNVRRGAQMAIMHSEHPDVGRFCVAKRDEENLSNFNISVGLTDRFLEAVKNDEMYTLVDPTTDEAYIDHEPFETVPESLHFYDPKYEDAWNDQYNKPGEDEHGKAIESNFWRDYYDEMGDPEAFDEFRDRIDLEVGEPLELPARFIWQMLIDGSHHLGEPGFYYIDKANDEHSFDVEENYGEYLHSTNPCFTGDTLVATADGRGGIPIEELTTEDEVPIYTRSEDGDANVALATNIRKTRTDADLVTVKTDGDATVTCTPDHPIWTRNRGWVNAGNLEAGDSLHMLYEREHTEGYRAVEWTGCDTPHNLEHRMVVDGILDMDLAGDAVHHKNGDKTDNRPENLTVMDPSEHGSMHARDISGDNNPIYDLKERGEFEDYKARNSFYQTSGDDNPMSGERATVVCQECGEEFKNVTNTHLKAAHDMTTDEYREKYPEKPMVKLDSNHTVTAVEPAGSADVYDLEVPGTHNFYASNEGGEYINVHNCGEQSLTDGEPCNLGHVNLSLMADEDAPTFAEWCSDDGRSRTSSHVRDYLEVGLDMELFEETTKTGTRFLDNVITMNDFPLEKNREAANNKRKIGVGLMGFHQLCLQLGIEYGTNESYAMAEEIMRLIDTFAVEESYILADERGPFERYENSKWADPEAYPEWFEKHAHNDPEAFPDGYPVRNHNMTTIAPTGTTSMIGNTTGGCEPIYNVANFKNVSDDVQGEGMLIEMDDLFLDTIEANGLDVDAVKAEIKQKLNNDEFTGTDDLETVPDAIGELFVTSGDLSVEQHIRVQAAFQTYCDSSISKTVNIRNSASLADIGEAIGLACELGCKGGTIYRIGSRTEEVKTTSTTGGGVSIKEADEDDLLEELDERGVEIPDTVTVADD